MGDAGQQAAGGKAVSEPAPSNPIDVRIAGLGDWRGDTLAAVRPAIALNLAKGPSALR